MVNFTFKLIDSPEFLEKIYQLRFEIYVKEYCFISESDCSEGKETDKFDKYSIYLVALDSKENLAAAVRLVLDSPFGFPLEEHCDYPLFDNKYKLSRRNTVEISRLVINRCYRARDTISQILLSLYRVGYRISKHKNITCWIAAIEKPLFRLINTCGFIFHPLGKPINYYGQVTPYLGVIDEIEENLQSLQQEFIYI